MAFLKVNKNADVLEKVLAAKIVILMIMTATRSEGLKNVTLATISEFKTGAQFPSTISITFHQIKVKCRNQVIEEFDRNMRWGLFLKKRMYCVDNLRKRITDY